MKGGLTTVYPWSYLHIQEELKVSLPDYWILAGRKKCYEYVYFSELKKKKKKERLTISNLEPLPKLPWNFNFYT